MFGRTLVVACVLAGLGANLAPAASVSAKRCKSSQVKTKLTIVKTKGHKRHRATVCLPRRVKRPASPAAALRQARAIALKRAPKQIKRLLRKKAPRRVRAAAKITDRALLRGLNPLAQAARITHESDTQTLRGGPPGTTTVQHREATGWDDEEPEPGVEATVAIDTTSTRIGGVASSKSTRAKLVRRMSRCPDASGIGNGILTYTQSEKQLVNQPNGGTASKEERFEFDSKVLVHFNDEAHVSSVEVVGTWKWSSESRVSDRRIRLDAVGGGISGNPSPEGRLAGFNSTVTNATSPGLAIFGPLFSVLASEIPKGFISELVSEAQKRAVGGRCARLVPEPVTVRVKPRQTVELTSGLVDFDSAPLPGTVKATAAKATVTAQAEADPTARFTYTALSAVPPGRTDTVTLKHVSKRGRASDKTVTVIYDDPPPPPLPNAYAGTISGTWDSASFGEEHWTYTGNVRLAYAGDEPAPPPGGPPDRYRRFTVTTGSAQVSMTATFSDGCGVEGSASVTIDPGDQSGYLSVQATQKPAYLIGIQSRGKSITVTRTGAADSCDAGETTTYPVPGIWAQTQSAHTSASSTLADSEDDSTPQTPFDYDTVSTWSLAPA